MRLLGLGESFEPVRDLAEPFLASRLGHARVHVGVLVRLPRDGRGEVQRRVADRLVGSWICHLLQVVQVAVGVAGLAVGGVTEVAGDLRMALDVGDLREVEVAAVRHRLAGECRLQVLVGLRSFQLSHASSLLELNVDVYRWRTARRCGCRAPR